MSTDEPRPQNTAHPSDFEASAKRTLGGVATHASGLKLRFEVLVWLKPGKVIRVGPDIVLFNADDYAQGMEHCLQLPIESFDLPRVVRQLLKPNPVGLHSVPAAEPEPEPESA